MSRFLDFFRLLFISLEFLFAIIPLAVYFYFPDWMDILLKPMSEGVGWGMSMAGLTLAMLAFCYKEGFELLSLNGGKKVLLEWPGYPMHKTRVLISFAWCVVGLVFCVAATWMVAKDIHPLFGITLAISGLISAAISTATVALARFRLRELIGE